MGGPCYGEKGLTSIYHWPPVQTAILSFNQKNFRVWEREAYKQPSQFEQVHAWLDEIVGKFRPRLIELTIFKPKLLIRLLWTNLVKTNKYQYHVKIMYNKIINMIRYDDPGKPIKRISFIVKNLGGSLLEK